MRYLFIARIIDNQIKKVMTVAIDGNQLVAFSFHDIVCGIIRKELNEYWEDPIAANERALEIESRINNINEKSVICMKEYTDGMRQTIVANLGFLGITEPKALEPAQKGDLDQVLAYFQLLQSVGTGEDESPDSGVVDGTSDDTVDLDDSERALADRTAFMIPIISAWQKDLGRSTNP